MNAGNGKQILVMKKSELDLLVDISNKLGRVEACWPFNRLPMTIITKLGRYTTWVLARLQSLKFWVCLLTP